MARPVCLLSLFCLALLATQTEGKCSQFGHSCFGAHGKRAETYPGNQVQVQDDPRFPLDDNAELYPPSANQVSMQDDARFQLEEQQALSNPEIVANVRNWLGVLGRRLRRVGSRSAPSAPAPAPAFLQ